MLNKINLKNRNVFVFIFSLEIRDPRHFARLSPPSYIFVHIFFSFRMTFPCEKLIDSLCPLVQLIEMKWQLKLLFSFRFWIALEFHCKLINCKSIGVSKSMFLHEGQIVQFLLFIIQLYFFFAHEWNEMELINLSQKKEEKMRSKWNRL